MNYYKVYFYGNHEPKTVLGHSKDTVMNEFVEMFGVDSIDRVEPVSIHQKEQDFTKRGAKVSVLTGYNPFADRLAEAEEKKKGNVTINVAGDESDDDKNDKEAKEAEVDSNVKIDKDSPDANGDGKVDAKDDLNKDGKVDAKDLKIAELEKDLRIKELEKGIEDMDDPAPEEKMKEASRLRIKDRGDSFECLDEKGKCVKKFPYDNKETFARAARYDAQRFAEKHYAKQLGEDVDLEEKDDPCWDGYEMVGTKMKDGKEVPNCVPIEEVFGLDEKRAFIFAAAKAKKEGKKKFVFNGKEYPITLKADVIKEGIDEAVDKKALKMLQSLEPDEARMIIQGMPKNDQRAYMKALGIKEKVDGRTSAYKETAARLMAKKEQVEEQEEDDLEEKAPKMKGDSFKKEREKGRAHDAGKRADRKKMTSTQRSLKQLRGEEAELEEAGYNDPPETKAEADKKFPDIETDVKNKESKEVTKISVSEAYTNYISLTNKK